MDLGFLICKMSGLGHIEKKDDGVKSETEISSQNHT